LEQKSTLAKLTFIFADVVYAVVYSLLLLNTDLHVAQGSHTRMTRSAFVKNTMMTVRDTRTPVEQNIRAIQLSKVWEDQMESLLRDMYASVKGNQILQPLQPGARKNGYLKRRMGSIRRSVRSSMLFTFSAEMKEQVKYPALLSDKL
jgi:Sec7 domain